MGDYSMPSEWEGLVWMKQRGRNSGRVASARVTLQGANLSVSRSDLPLTGGKSERVLAYSRCVDWSWSTQSTGIGPPWVGCRWGRQRKRRKRESWRTLKGNSLCWLLPDFRNFSHKHQRFPIRIHYARISPPCLSEPPKSHVLNSHLPTCCSQIFVARVSSGKHTAQKIGQALWTIAPPSGKQQRGFQ